MLERAGQARRNECRGLSVLSTSEERRKVAGQPGPVLGERLLTVSEVASVMRVSNMTVYRLIKSGQLSAIRVGKNYRIRESEVDRYLRERVVGG